MLFKFLSILILQFFLITNTNINHAFAQEKTEINQQAPAKKTVPLFNLDRIKQTLVKRDFWLNTFISTIAIISIAGFVLGIVLKEFLLIVLGLICIFLTIVSAYLIIKFQKTENFIFPKFTFNT